MQVGLSRGKNTRWELPQEVDKKKPRPSTPEDKEGTMLNSDQASDNGAHQDQAEPAGTGQDQERGPRKNRHPVNGSVDTYWIAS